ncbi:MAG: hypothetical protein HY952_04990 [Elusimicrobia bacterium]|nr:hypothetical protein [Elusimicrobiota bacterium]
MKAIFTLIAIAMMSGPAFAADFADLQKFSNSDIPKVNPFPEPGNPDSCYLTGLKDGLCNFKCRSGETFQVKPVKPEAASVYEKCGGGDYRGAKAATEAQTYKSYGKHTTFAEASAALNWALNDLKLAKVEVLSQKIVVYGLADYHFEISLRAKSALLIEPSPSYQRDLDAYERMFDASERLESRGATVVIHEVRKDGPDSYSFVIGYFAGTRADKSAADMTITRPLLQAKMQSNTLRTVALSMKGLEQQNSPNKAPAEYTRGLENASEVIEESLLNMEEAIAERNQPMLHMETIRLEPTIAKLSALAKSIEGNPNYKYWGGEAVKRLAADLGRNIAEIRINAPFAF